MIKRINLHGKDMYYIDDIIDKYGLSGTYASKDNIMRMVVHFGGKNYVSKEDYTYIDGLAMHETTCYTIPQVIQVTGLTDYTLSSHGDMFDRIFTHVDYCGTVFYSRDEVDAFAEELQGVPFPTSVFCSRVYGEPVIYINDLYHYAYDKKVELLDRRQPGICLARMMFSPDVRVDICGNVAIRTSASIDALLESCSKISLANILDNQLAPFDQSKIGTIALMRQFYNHKMNASDSPRSYDVAIDYSAPLCKMYRNLYKEIFDYSEQELEDNVLSKEWCNNKVVMQFLQYVKDRTDNKFAVGIRFIYRARYYKNINPDTYTSSEWGAFYDYITDLGIHVARAYKDRVYCQYWLAMLVYLTSLIRISDIVSLRTIGLEDGWYLRRGALVQKPLALHEAVMITDVFRRDMEALPTVKTDQLKHYYPTIEVAPSIATAICILEYHRIHEDDIKLFTIRSAVTDRISDKFDDIPIRFQSTKATKTLASMIHAKAEEKGMTNALFLVSSARSHRMREGFSEVTSVYIQESKLEGDPVEIARYVCRRGVFGWLYTAMLQYINGNIKSLEEATTQVEMIKSRIKPEQAERIADFLKSAETEQRSVLKQLAGYSRNNIAKFLMQIGTPATATSVPETFCIYGKSCSKLRAEPTACLRCNCSLKTNYVLELIVNTIYELADRINDVEMTSITERQKLTFQINQALFVLMDAKVWYDKYDPAFLKAYVDLPRLRSSIAAIPECKYLGIEEKI